MGAIKKPSAPVLRENPHVCMYSRRLYSKSYVNKACCRISGLGNDSWDIKPTYQDSVDVSSRGNQLNLISTRLHSTRIVFSIRLPKVIRMLAHHTNNHRFPLMPSVHKRLELYIHGNSLLSRRVCTRVLRPGPHSTYCHRRPCNSWRALPIYRSFR